MVGAVAAIGVYACQWEGGCGRLKKRGANCMSGSVEEFNAQARKRFGLRLASSSLLVAGLLLLGCGGDSGGSQNRPELTCDAQVPVVTATDVESQIMTPVCSSCHAPGGGGVGAPGQWE